MTSAPTRQMSKAEYDELRAQKLEAAQSRLADAVAEIQSGQDWKDYLAMQSKLHSYSANNVILLSLQHRAAFEEGRVSTPFPSYVAGFNTWRSLGRTVEKGQKGYTILAPTRVTVREARDAAGNVRPLRGSEAAAAGETEQKRSFMRGFSTTTVFAAEQTRGKELPVPPEPRLLEGEAPPGLGDAITQLIASKGYEVATVADKAALGGANGQTDFAAKTVQVRADMDDAAMVKTLLHEAAHVLLHEAPTGRALPRSVQEVEAESVAFIVADAHGMPTDGYTFPYVAGWGGEQASDLVQSTATRVARAAKELISASPALHVAGGHVPGQEKAITRDPASHGSVNRTPAASQAPQQLAPAVGM
jgi:antirestriction protein ArdC